MLIFRASLHTTIKISNSYDMLLTNTTNSLIILVNSLSKAEKRYFRLFSDLQNGEKNYLKLFNLIDENCSSEILYTKFCRSKSANSYEMAVKHLYRTLLDCLVKLREKQDVQTEICNQISKANILFEREMFDEAFHELEKAKKLAITYENDPLSLLIGRTELRYLNALDFKGISEKLLVAKQMKVHEIVKYSKNLNQHLQLYEILRHRLIYKGFSRSDKQKENLNDLVLSELHLIANSSYQGFEAGKLHLLFQATYYLNSGNYKSAIRQYQEIILHFEENKHLIQNPPVHYLNALQGVLESLQIAGLYDEMPFFLSKLKEISEGKYSREFTLSVKAMHYLYEQNRFMQTGDFQSSYILRTEQENFFQKNILSLTLEVQLKLLLYSVIHAMYTGDLNLARKHMKKITRSGKIFHTLPSYKTVRLVNLLLQAELGNFDFLENEVTSIKRRLGTDRQMYTIEKLIFCFTSSYPLPLYEKSKRKLWEQLQTTIRSIKKNKYEFRLIRVFDVISWIEYKLTSKPLSEILIKKRE